MGLGVVRFEPTRDAPSPALVDHVAGRTRPASAYIREHLGVDVETIEPSAVQVEAELARARAILAAKRGGRRPHLGISWLFAGGPATDDVHADESTIPADAPATLAEGRPWTLADCRRFHQRTRKLILEACPDAADHLVSSLHLDEKAVHSQHEMIAMTGGRVGNQGVREALVRLAPGFAEANAAARARLVEKEEKAKAKAAGKGKRRRRFRDKGAHHVYVDHHEQMRLVHDLYAERFADFGIVRGPGGKRQHHERVDRGKGMEAKRRAIERETERAERRLDQIERDCQTVADLKEQRDKLGREVGAQLEQAREQRDREVDAVAAAREQREREEAAGWGPLRKHGRELLAKHAREIRGVEAQRDAARADLAKRTEERDRALGTARDLGQQRGKRRRFVLWARRRLQYHAAKSRARAEREAAAAQRLRDAVETERERADSAERECTSLRTQLLGKAAAGARTAFKFAGRLLAQTLERMGIQAGTAEPLETLAARFASGDPFASLDRSERSADRARRSGRVRE